MKHLYFVRHGLSVMNKQGIFSGRNDTPLTQEGKDQCLIAAKSLSGINIDQIITSPMKRTLETAQIIAKEIGYPLKEIIVSDLFVERSFGPLEGTTYTRKHNLDKIGGVEHSSSVLIRAQEGLDLLNSIEKDNILLVSHGAIGRALRYILDPSIDYHEFEGFNNAEIVQLI